MVSIFVALIATAYVDYIGVLFVNHFYSMGRAYMDYLECSRSPRAIIWHMKSQIHCSKAVAILAEYFGHTVL